MRLIAQLPCCSTATICQAFIPPHIPIKRTSSDCMRLTISFGPTKHHARLTQSLTPFPAATHHQTISPLSSPNILMQKSVRILRFSLKCIRQFRQCPCRILQAAAALRPIWTRTAISSRKRISRSRPSNYSMTISSFNMT